MMQNIILRLTESTGGIAFSERDDFFVLPKSARICRRFGVAGDDADSLAFVQQRFAGRVFTTPGHFHITARVQRHGDMGPRGTDRFSEKFRGDAGWGWRNAGINCVVRPTINASSATTAATPRRDRRGAARRCLCPRQRHDSRKRRGTGPRETPGAARTPMRLLSLRGVTWSSPARRKLARLLCISSTRPRTRASRAQAPTGAGPGEHWVFSDGYSAVTAQEPAAMPPGSPPTEPPMMAP